MFVQISTKLLIALTVLFSLMLVGCAAVGPDYVAPETSVPEKFEPLLPERVTTDDQINLPGTWWELLGDDTLVELINKAAQQNLDIRIAQSRLRESRAGRRAAEAGQFPALGGAGVVSTQQQSENSPFFADIPPQFGGNDAQTDLFQAGFDASWEIDIFGGVRRSVEAAEARYQAAEAGRNEVLRVVLAEVALNYAELRGLQKRKLVLENNIRVQQETLNFTRNRLESGLGTELEVSQASSQLLTTRSALPGIQAAIKLRIFQIANLLGEQPQSRVEQLMVYTPLPQIPDSLFSDVPSEVLRRRPDIMRAERQLAAETADIGVATADLFPKFSLFGGFGVESANVDTLFSSDSIAWSIGPSFSWAIFQGGRIRANIEAQSAQSERALAEYEKTVLNVLQDVNSALVSHSYERETASNLLAAARETRNSLDLSMTLYDEGLSDFLSVLNAEALLLLVEDRYTSSQTSEWTSLIRLYKALGGGWQNYSITKS